MTLTLKNSGLDKTKHALSKIWSFLILNEFVRNVRLKACEEARPSLTDNEFMRRIKKREQDQMRREYIQQKGSKIIETWECKWWELYRTDTTVKNHLRADFPYQQPLSEERLMQEIKSGRLFGYVQCDLKAPEHLKSHFANFPQFSKILLYVEMISDI